MRDAVQTRTEQEADVEVRIRGLMMDPVTNMPMIVLKDVAGDGVLPIWVGIFEANAIALEIEKSATPRPMTHDLLRNALRAYLTDGLGPDLARLGFYHSIHDNPDGVHGPFLVAERHEGGERDRRAPPGSAADAAAVLAVEEAEARVGQGPDQSRRRSLMAVFERVCASTVLTITAQ